MSFAHALSRPAKTTNLLVLSLMGSLTPEGRQLELKGRWARSAHRPIVYDEDQLDIAQSYKMRGENNSLKYLLNIGLDFNNIPRF